MYLEREAPPLAFLRAPLQISSNSLNSSYKSLFFFQAEDGIRDHAQSRGLGDVYKRQVVSTQSTWEQQAKSLGSPEPSITTKSIAESSKDLSLQKHGKWTPEEDELLRNVVQLYGEKQWRKISDHIPGRSAIQCLHRWTKILKPGLKKGPWTIEEDQKLISWVKKEGPTKWAQAAALIKGRSGKQCRERWYNNLNPDVKKGDWTEEEDGMIFQLYRQHGSSWSKIAKYLPGRTENSIKNRFYSTLRKLASDKRKTILEGGSVSRDPLINPTGSQPDTEATPEPSACPVKNLEESTPLPAPTAPVTANITSNNVQSNVETSNIVLNTCPTNKSSASSLVAEALNSLHETIMGNHHNALTPDQTSRMPQSCLYKLLQELNVNATCETVSSKGAVRLDNVKISRRDTKKSTETRSSAKNKRKQASKVNKLQANEFPVKHEEGRSSIHGDSTEDTERRTLNENDSDSQYDNLLNTIENTLNTEFLMSNLDLFQNLSIDQLQGKILEFCNTNVFDMSRISSNNNQRQAQKVPEVKIQTKDEAMDICPGLEEDLMNKEELLSFNQSIKQKLNQSNLSINDKMVFLLEQLSSLEGMLKSARQELLMLESSLHSQNGNNSQNIQHNNNHMIPASSKNTQAASLYSSNNHNNKLPLIDHSDSVSNVLANNSYATHNNTNNFPPRSLLSGTVSPHMGQYYNPSVVHGAQTNYGQGSVHNNTTNNQHPGLFFEEEEELFPLAQPYGDIFGCDQFQNEFDILRNYSSFGNNNASSVSNANQNYNANSLLNKRQRDLYDEFNEFEEICNGALRKARGGASLSRYMDLFDEQKTQDTHQAFTWLNDEGLDSKPKTNFY
eukprot:TRINITY_DN7804_c0_g1_i6.p1 TRINITY_DN7804_c0_g1~~TRINITY_DN7804_c0_g1_i6.p1  ORF type:complete len:844 (-),score=291.32 TRINITY_DN7804_c0_g1_i6:306-2837(-)